MKAAFWFACWMTGMVAIVGVCITVVGQLIPLGWPLGFLAFLPVLFVALFLAAALLRFTVIKVDCDSNTR